MKNKILQYWKGPGGCGEVLALSIPLIISVGANSILMFTDRVFLMWYSADAMAAALQAGIANFAIVSLFLGIVSYVNTFVAQYYGAAAHNRIGSAVWQGIYLSAVTGTLMLLLIPLARPLFLWMGHQKSVFEYEMIYFQIMCVGALPMLLTSALSCFFTGRGDTKTVMWVNLLSTMINIVLDYVMIFGKLGCPVLGVAGAGWATVIASFFSAAAYFYIFIKPKNRTGYATLKEWRLDFTIMRRLIRFGLPNGVQFMLDVLAFAVFVMLVGRISQTALAATSIAFGINTLAFMPMLGVGTAVSTLVGQSLGKNQPALAQRSTWSGFFISSGYMTILAAGYWLVPRLFLYPFSMASETSEYAAIEPIAVKLLCFVAFYCLFDTGNIIFSAALKGAGDTRFVMVITIALGWVIMVLPSYLAVKYDYGIYMAWSFATVYVCSLALVFFFRFLSGKWKDMRVIESVPLKSPAGTTQMPTVDI